MDMNVYPKPSPSHCYTQAAPGATEDASSKLWLYRSMMTQQTDANSGLVGPIIISKAPIAASDGSPSDVDVEFITLFQVLHTLQTSSFMCRIEQVGHSVG